jgi:hypothetical protein
MSPSLKQCLSDYPRVMLEGIADGWHISLTDEQRDEVVARLASEMAHPSAVNQVLGRLGEPELEALALVAAKAQTRSFVVTRKYGDIRHLGPGKLEWQRAWQKPSSPLERLWFLGLVFRGYGVDGGYHGDVLYVADDIRELLPALALPMPESQVDPVDPPATVLDQGDALSRSVFVFLVAARRGLFRARERAFPARAVKRMASRLQDASDSRRLELAWHLCLASGLLEQRDRVWAPTDTAAQWLRDSPVQRLRLLFQSWMRDLDWNELCHLPHVQCEPAGWSADPSLARKALVRHMGACPLDAWLSAPALVQSIYQVDPDFARPDGDYDSWYIRDAQTGQYLTGFHQWGRVEGAWLRYLLEVPLYWLGLVALGEGSEGGSLDSFRVTSLGAQVMGLVEEEAHEPRPFALEGSVRVRAPWDGSWYDRYLLERFARWQQDETSGSLYLIDGSSVQAADDQGINAQQIVAFLERVTEEPVPRSVRRWIHGWATEGSRGNRRGGPS